MKECPKPTQFKKFSEIFSNTVIGGTFDRLHIGHKGLISLALEVSRKAHICIMSEKWVKEKSLKNKIESFEKRLKNIKTFLEETSFIKKSIISEIHDPYSYALTGPYAKKLDSIVISDEKAVLERTIYLNEQRIEKGLPTLKIIKMPMILDPRGKIFSSTRIRQGDLKIPSRGITLKIPEKMREELKEPKGDLLNDANELPKPSKCVISIGDIVTESLMEIGYPISIAIVDRKSRRFPHYSYFFKIKENKNQIDTPIILPTVNPAGVITFSAWYSTLVALSQRQPTVIRVFGEEDLLGFPAVLLAPKGSFIIYGDPFRNKLVLIEVDDEIKERAKKDLLKIKANT